MIAAGEGKNVIQPERAVSAPFVAVGDYINPPATLLDQQWTDVPLLRLWPTRLLVEQIQRFSLLDGPLKRLPQLLRRLFSAG